MSKYKKPKCRLTGENGNIFNIMGKVVRTLKRTGHRDKAEEFIEKSKDLSYDGIIRLAEDYVNVE